MANRWNKSDIVGKRFGRLLVVEDSGKRNGSNVVWACLCDCGNMAYVPTRHLTCGRVVSCGCRRQENMQAPPAVDPLQSWGVIDGTNASKIASSKPQRNNTSGARGVSHKKYKGKIVAWIAYIRFKNKRYHLGTYARKDDAIKARKNAEDQIFGPFLEWYYTQYPDKRK